ncbi:MAG: hypothetical protein WAL30_06460 [Candidatus Aquirickettsiella sp.]
MPPVSAQDRKEIAVQLLTMGADDDYLSPQREVTPPTLASLPAIPFPDERAARHLRTMPSGRLAI